MLSKGLDSQALTPQLYPLILDHHQSTLSKPMRFWHEHQNIPSVLLLSGPSGIGKRTVAFYFAQWFLCENGTALPCPPSSTACGSCSRVLHGQAVEVTEIKDDSAEENEGRGSLKIEQFRQIKEKMGFGGTGRASVYIIPRADRMTPQASNSILKLLEEPPTGWRFILTATDESLLLPTIISRCQVLRLKPFSTPTLDKLLETKISDPVKRKICAKLSQGSLSRAVAFSEDEAWERRKEIVSFLSEPARSLQNWMDWASASPMNLELLLDLLEQTLDDLLKWASGAPHTDDEQALQKYATETCRKMGSAARARSYWLVRAELIFEIRKKLTAPVNRKILIQDLLLPWLEANS